LAADASDRLTADSGTDEYREFCCDLCGSTTAVELTRAREFTNGEPIHICRQCGFVYVKRRRSAERIAEVWSKDLFGDTYTAARPAIVARLTYVAEFLNGTVGLRGRTVCDIGAGEGRFLSIIRGPQYGANVFGIEPSMANRHVLQAAGIEHFTGTIEEFEQSSNTRKRPVELVTILWTLEACQDCRGMLSTAHRMLAPDGHIVVATGSRILVPFKKPLDAYLSRNPADTHPFRFSVNTLRGILAVSGFAVSHVNPYVDHDVLCMIARKAPDGETSPWRGDDYLDVHNFFERWYADTRIYYSNRCDFA
jgi:hypothetical protein